MCGQWEIWSADFFMEETQEFCGLLIGRYVSVVSAATSPLVACYWGQYFFF